jgi:hypothetical protein
MNIQKLQLLKTTYAQALAESVAAFPSLYCFDIADVPKVAEKMGAAFERGSYNKDGRAVKLMCKRLGISHTYSGINNFLEGSLPLLES